MKNHTKELPQFEPMNKLFDCVRLIDIQEEILYTEHLIHTSPSAIPAFDFQAHQELYNRCLVSDLAIYRVEPENNRLLLLAAIPVYIQGNKYIMECTADVTDRIDANILIGQSTVVMENAYKLSVTDELTGLYNRRYINQALPLAITTCAKKGIPLSVIFTDLDYFKQTNDSYGHATGDHLLCEFAKELRKSVRKSTDWSARYGGDEFLLCLVGADNIRAKTIAEQIRKTIECKTFEYHGHKIKMTCSFGIYTIDDFTTMPTCDSILEKVDVQLYASKNAGRNMVK